MTTAILKIPILSILIFVIFKKIKNKKDKETTKRGVKPLLPRRPTVYPQAVFLNFKIVLTDWIMKASK